MEGWRPLCSHKYRISQGRYIGRWCRVQEYHPVQDFVTITLMDAWGKDTVERDAIPAKFLER